MPTVALFSTHFVEYSQTFVYDEICAHERYSVEVFCKTRMNADRFPFDPVHVGGRFYAATRADTAFDAAFSSRRFALVHAHFGRGGVYAMRYAEKFRLPLLVTFHGYDVPILRSPARFEPRYLRYALFGPKLLRTMTLGLCASTELFDMLREMGVPRERLRVHHIGIDVDRFHGEPRAPGRTAEVIMIGRFVEKKGFEDGIRAFARVGKTLDARLTLVGGGDRESRYRALAMELGVASRVHFAGVLTSAEVAGRLRESDVLLAPSVVGYGGNRESGLLSVKEASASCVVPVGTRHGGIPEIIDDGVTGYLVPERNVDALSERLAQLLADPALRATMGRAARAKMRGKYDNRARVRALEDRYDEAIARHGRE